jgi:hypothetical protein
MPSSGDNDDAERSAERAEKAAERAEEAAERAREAEERASQSEHPHHDHYDNDAPDTSYEGSIYAGDDPHYYPAETIDSNPDREPDEPGPE